MKNKKVILVTGSSSGIGEYLFQKYQESDDYEVLGLDINTSNNTSVNFFQVDLRDEEATSKVFTNIKDLDLAINCAGVSSLRKPLLDFTNVEFIKAFQDNLLPCLNSMQNELRIMKKQGFGKIINIASITGLIGIKNFSAYSGAKASIINLTKVAAIEHSKDNIQINSISPATIDTPMIRKKYNGNLRDYSDVFYTKNCGSTNDIYTVVKMLEENNFMTGNDLKLDGGLTDLFTI